MISPVPANLFHLPLQILSRAGRGASRRASRRASLYSFQTSSSSATTLLRQRHQNDEKADGLGDQRNERDFDCPPLPIEPRPIVTVGLK